MDDKTFICIFMIQIDLYNFRIIRRYLSIHTTQYLCRSDFKFLLIGHRHSHKRDLIQRTDEISINSVFPVLFYGTYHPVRIVTDQSRKFSRISIASFLNSQNLSLIKCSAFYLQKLSCIYIADSMSQCSVSSVLIYKSQSTDSLRIISHPDSKLICPLHIFHRSEGERNDLVVSQHFYFYILTIQCPDIFNQFSLGMYDLRIKCHNVVSWFYNVFGRFSGNSLF